MVLILYALNIIPQKYHDNPLRNYYDSCTLGLY